MAEIVNFKILPIEGDWEKDEFGVFAYFSLTGHRSRCRIRKGGSKGEYVSSPTKYTLGSGDVLEYMPNYNDLLILLKALQKADDLRELRKNLKDNGVGGKDLTDKLKKEVDDHQKEIDENIAALKEGKPKMNFAEMLNKLGYIKAR